MKCMINICRKYFSSLHLPIILLVNSLVPQSHHLREDLFPPQLTDGSVEKLVPSMLYS